jgi:hypothetical protein
MDNNVWRPVSDQALHDLPSDSSGFVVTTKEIKFDQPSTTKAAPTGGKIIRTRRAIDKDQKRKRIAWLNQLYAHN